MSSQNSGGSSDSSDGEDNLALRQVGSGIAAMLVGADLEAGRTASIASTIQGSSSHSLDSPSTHKKRGKVAPPAYLGTPGTKLESESNARILKEGYLMRTGKRASSNSLGWFVLRQEEDGIKLDQYGGKTLVDSIDLQDAMIVPGKKGVFDVTSKRSGSSWHLKVENQSSQHSNEWVVAMQMAVTTPTATLTHRDVDVHSNAVSEFVEEKSGTRRDVEEQLKAHLEQLIKDLATKHLSQLKFLADPTPHPREESILRGRLNAVDKLPARAIKTFLSGTFADSRHERSWLTKHTLPALQKWCNDVLRLPFYLVDVMQGIQNEIVDSHDREQLHVNEVCECLEDSAGPSFLSLQAQRYGYCVLPKSIEGYRFKTFQRAMKQSEDTVAIFDRWYKRDDNAVPALFVLQPAMTIFGAGWHEVPATVAQFEKEYHHLQTALATYAPLCFSPEVAQQYVRSLSSSEIHFGVTKNPQAKDNVFWLHREITDLAQHIEDPAYPCFIDTDKGNQSDERQTDDGAGNDDKDATNNDEDDDQLKPLAKSKMLKTLHELLVKHSANRHVQHYLIKWVKQSGVNPEENVTHAHYLARLCLDAAYKLITSISADCMEQLKVKQLSPAALESLEHLLIGKTFHNLQPIQTKNGFARDDSDETEVDSSVLKRITAYLSDYSGKPLILSGAIGSGRSRLITQVAQQILTQHHKKRWPALLIRYIGGTSLSTSVTSLISGLCEQLSQIFNVPWSRPRSPEHLVSEFHRLLALSSGNTQVILLLDSIDLVTGAGNAPVGGWIPSNLPIHCKIIASTLKSHPSCAHYEEILDETCIVQVPPFPQDHFEPLIENLLATQGRTVTSQQEAYLMEHIQSFAETPLEVQLCTEAACFWTSNQDPSSLDLPKTINELLYLRVKKAEVSTSPEFVERALGIIAASRDGVRLSELLSALDSDENLVSDVLVASLQAGEGAEHRLPYIYWCRLKRDMGDALFTRIDPSGGENLIALRHRYHAMVCKRYEDSIPLAQKLLVSVWRKLLSKEDISKPTITRLARELPRLCEAIEDDEVMFDCLLNLKLFKCLYEAFVQNGDTSLSLYWRAVGGTPNDITAAYKEVLSKEEERLQPLKPVAVKQTSVDGTVDTLDTDQSESEKEAGLNNVSDVVSEASSLNDWRMIAGFQFTVGDFLSRLGWPLDALEFFNRALEIQQQIEENSESCAAVLAAISDQQFRLEKLPEALAAATQALELRSQVCGTDDSQTALSFCQVASIAAVQGDSDGAVAKLRAAIHIYEKQKPHIDLQALVAAKVQLATLQHKIGSDDAATIERLLNLITGDESLPSTHPASFMVKSALGNIYFAQRNQVEDETVPLQKAADYVSEALKSRSLVFGSSCDELVADLTNLGHIHKAGDRPEDALRSFQQALVILKKAAVEDTVQIAKLYVEIAELSPIPEHASTLLKHASAALTQATERGMYKAESDPYKYFSRATQTDC